MQIPPKEEIRRKGRQMRNREAAKKFRERKKKQIADLEKKVCILSAQNPNAEMADLLERLDQVFMILDIVYQKLYFVPSQVKRQSRS
ncbi:hypothetical protein FOMA001_g18221 [Fusarium oxysporum f. sp. matthiolae]|nr:hypothetical protein FOMA001_g18221 [Fusarium oxysporum f. sp. matthiolae]